MSEANTERLDHDEHVENLYQLLNQESALLEKLLDILKLKQRAIVAGDIEELQMFTSNEQGLVRKLNELGEAKQTALQNASRSLGVIPQSLTISELIKSLNNAVKPQWIQTKEELENLIDEIYKVNLQNNELILTARQFLRDFVDVLLPEDDQQTQLYDKEGEISTKTKSKKVLNFKI